MRPQLTLTTSTPSPDASLPLLMHFPSGPPPRTVLQSGKDGGLRLHHKCHAEEKKRQKSELEAESEVMQYTGSVRNRHGTAAEVGGSLLIGVHQRGTGMIRLLPPSHLYAMTPTIKGARVPLGVPDAAGGDRAATSANPAAQKRHLVSSFGSAKAVKRQRSIAAAAVSSEAIYNATSLGGDLVTAANEAVEATQATAELTARDRHALHPPFNLEATTLEGAYPLDGLVPHHVWSTLDYKPLKSAAHSQEQREAVKAQGSMLYPPFILSELAAPLPAGKTERHDALRKLLFLCYMLRFRTLQHAISPGKADVGRSEATSCDHHPDAAKLRLPLAAWQHLVAEFTEPLMPREGMAPPATDGATSAAAKRKMTPELREKLALHSLALALLLKRGRLSTAALAADLGLTESKYAPPPPPARPHRMHDPRPQHACDPRPPALHALACPRMPSHALACLHGCKSMPMPKHAVGANTASTTACQKGPDAPLPCHLLIARPHARSLRCRCAFYLKQLGCKIERKSGSPNLAVLQLPLTFPKVSRGPVQRS